MTSPLQPSPLTDEQIAELVSRYELYDYQRDGVRHLVRNTSALLADDMGLGKTRQAICAAHILSGLDGHARSVTGAISPVRLRVSHRFDSAAWRLREGGATGQGACAGRHAEGELLHCVRVAGWPGAAGKTAAQAAARARR